MEPVKFCFIFVLSANNPEHTIENHYSADTRQDKTEDKKCGKSYNRKATITGGFTHFDSWSSPAKTTISREGKEKMLYI